MVHEIKETQHIQYIFITMASYTYQILMKMIYRNKFIIAGGGLILISLLFECKGASLPGAWQLQKMFPISPFLLNSSHSCPVRLGGIEIGSLGRALQPDGWMESPRNRSRIICHQRGARLHGAEGNGMAKSWQNGETLNLANKWTLVCHNAANAPK